MNSNLHYKALKNILSISALLSCLACNGHPVGDDTKEKNDSNTAPPAGEQMTSPAPGRLRIMSYNVLRFGTGCQGSNEALHHHLKTIVGYVQPDVAALVKVDAIKQNTGDAQGDAPVGFADSILKQVFGGAYTVAPFTNKAAANNVNLLFYNRDKLGFAGMETLVVDETDFNLYKLYVRASVASNNHDTGFVYFLLNHTESGDKSKKRDRQMAEVMAALHQRFKALPNVVDLGDFNLRNTGEPGYQSLIAGNSEFHFDDPPFALDHSLKYPADWENDPDSYARYLTTSTRKKDGEPNDCGTGGGAKFWFDHILLSSSITGGRNGLSYLPNSFKVIGNDGNRTGRSVNAGKHPNTSVPASVAEALFQFSNKYPVVLELTISPLRH